MKFVSLGDAGGKREQNKFSSIVTFFVYKLTFVGFFLLPHKTIVNYTQNRALFVMDQSAAVIIDKHTRVN